MCKQEDNRDTQRSRRQKGRDTRDTTMSTHARHTLIAPLHTDVNSVLLAGLPKLVPDHATAAGIAVGPRAGICDADGAINDKLVVFRICHGGPNSNGPR